MLLKCGLQLIGSVPKKFIIRFGFYTHPNRRKYGCAYSVAHDYAPPRYTYALSNIIILYIEPFTFSLNFEVYLTDKVVVMSVFYMKML